MTRWRILIVAGALAASACGQRGPLVLPDGKAATATPANRNPTPPPPGPAPQSPGSAAPDQPKDKKGTEQPAASTQAP